MSLLLIGAFLKRFGREIALAVVMLGVAGYCHSRDTGLVQQGVNQERTRQADSVITVTETTFVTQQVVLAKALSHRDSQLIATRYELAAATKSGATGSNLGNEKPAEVPLSRDDSAGSGIVLTPAVTARDSTIPHLVRVCNTQIADDSTALAAALSALHTCEANGAAWKAKASIVQPHPSRLKPFVAGAVTGIAALAVIIHFVK